MPTMVSLFFIWHLINLLLVLPCEGFVWCAFGYVGSNVYLLGKNTYFQGYDNLPTEYYYSEATPLEADKSVFIWKNASDGCYHLLTLPSASDEGSIIPITGMTIHATCNDCTVSTIESCLLWNINGEGIDPNFKVQNTGQKCQADNWIKNNTLNTPHNQPPDICMHNTDQYNPTFNDINWELFSIDSATNPYYYVENKGHYLTQYFDNTTSAWYWIQYITKPSSIKQAVAYCKISGYPTQSILDCTPWFYQSTTNSSQYLLYNININDHDCSFVSDVICVYDSLLPYDTFNKDINGDYDRWPDNSNYDGFSKTSPGDLTYIRFQQNTWKIGYANDLDDNIYATCNKTIANTQINPFDITSCNGYWQLPNQLCCDTLTISNTECVNRPTRSPTLTPTISPSVSPTFTPSISPSYSPSIAPSISPTQPSMQPSYNPTYYPTYIPTKSPTVSIIEHSAIITTEIIAQFPANKKSEPATFWDQFHPSSNNFKFIIPLIIGIFFLCITIIISSYCCLKKYRDRKKLRKREEKQKERDIFREQITMDVSENVTRKVINGVSSVVAKTTKEAILESMHGSVYRAASPINHNTNMYGIAQLNGSQPGSQRTTPKHGLHCRSHPMRLNGHLQVSSSPAPHIMQIHPSHSTNHLSPNYLSSTIPMSSSNQKVSIDSHSEIYNAVPDVFNNKSPYTRSNAILSPDRHNSYRNSNSKSNIQHQIEVHKNMQYMIYNDAENHDNIPDIPPSEETNTYNNNDNTSVNYDDAHMDEKENVVRKISSNVSNRKVSNKIYGFNQPDVFPEEEEEGNETHTGGNEGYNNNDTKSIGQSVGYNNLKQIEKHLSLNNDDEEHYNSSSDQDEDEKHIQNEATLGSSHSGMEIEMQNRKNSRHNINHNNEPSNISMPYDKYEQQYSNKNIHSHNQHGKGRKHTDSSSYNAPYPYDAHPNHPNMYQQVQSNTNPNNNYDKHNKYFDSPPRLSNQPNDNMDDAEYEKLLNKICLDQSSSVGGDINEENDDVGPLQSQKYKTQMQFGHQLSPIMNNKMGSYKRKSGSEMSESHKSGKSFLTLNDEQKQIEISNVDLDDDLDDDSDDDTNHDHEHDHSTDRENSPLLSNHSNGNDNNSGNTDDLLDDTSTTNSDNDDEMEEFEVANNNYNEYMNKNHRKHRHQAVATHSSSFDIQIKGKIENPFKVIGVDTSVENSNMSFTSNTNNQNDCGPRNEIESFNFDDESHINNKDDVTNTMSDDHIEIQNDFNNNNSIPIVKGSYH